VLMLEVEVDRGERTETLRCSLLAYEPVWNDGTDRWEVALVAMCLDTSKETLEPKRVKKVKAVKVP